MDINLAKFLKPGDIINDTKVANSKGKLIHWKINGKPKTWKKDPNRIKIPIKFGLWEYWYVTEDNLDCFSIPETLEKRILERMLTSLDLRGE